MRAHMNYSDGPASNNKPAVGVLAEVALCRGLDLAATALLLPAAPHAAALATATVDVTPYVVTASCQAYRRPPQFGTT